VLDDLLLLRARLKRNATTVLLRFDAVEVG
jgi:hypothetical protein